RVAPQPQRAATRRRRRSIAALTGAGLVGLALVAGVAVSLGVSGSAPARALPRVEANSVGFIDPATGKISDLVPVGQTPSHAAVGDGAAWVTNADSDSVSRIDPNSRRVVQTIDVGSSPSGIAFCNGAVWVANSLDATVDRIDPALNRVVQPIPVGNGPV